MDLSFRPWRGVLLSLMVATTLAACNEQTDVAEPAPRPVRTVTLEKSEAGVPVVLTGRIEALDEASLGFRLSGRMIERTVNAGDRVKAGQLLGRLEALNELNALTAAKANVAAAQAKLTQVRNHFERQETLLAQGWTTRANFDQAERELRTAEAQLDASEAQLKAAHDQVDFTELKADADGVVTAVGAEPGEVVQAGQMIVRLARQGGRDAIFDVPAQVLRTAPTDRAVDVHLADDPSVTATGRVREVSPQADPVTRTFQVKVGLTDPPEAMRLGATVTGTLQTDAVPMIEIPSSALTEFNGHPAVWIVDPSDADGRRSATSMSCASTQPTVTVSQGLDAGDVVVTAGVQALRPGQKVRLLGIGTMKRLNLSEWALSHRSLVAYLMIVAVAAGVLSYFRLGRNEDPTFVIKTMVVKAVWPGATIEDTLNQVTERLERTLEETPTSRLPPQLHHRRRHHDLRQSEGKHVRHGGRRHLVSRAQEHRRHAAHAAVRRPGPVLQ